MPNWISFGEFDVLYERGFIGQIRCRLQFWYGTKCPHCPDRQGQQHRLYPGGWEKCEPCHGLGRLNARGPQIVAAHPVTRVVLTDREPNAWPANGPDNHGWFRGLRHRPHHTPCDEPLSVPEWLWDIMAESRGEKHGQWLDFPTKASAIDALSVALVHWARQAAGLHLPTVPTNHPTLTTP